MDEDGDSSRSPGSTVHIDSVGDAKPSTEPAPVVSNGVDSSSPPHIATGVYNVMLSTLLDTSYS